VRHLLPLRGWLPTILVGASAATVAELTAGLLLYASEGFIRSLTIILTVEMLALAVGLWTAPVWPTATTAGASDPDEEFVDDGVESLRRRWSLLLMVFAVAALYAGVWGMLQAYAPTPLFQGLGLGLLGALPLFAVGGLLGRMVTWEARRGPDRRRVGTPAALGASLGFLCAGGYLIPHLSPLSILLLCLIFLSAGALLYGQSLDRRLNPARDLSPDADASSEPEAYTAPDPESEPEAFPGPEAYTAPDPESEPIPDVEPVRPLDPQPTPRVPPVLPPDPHGEETP
jgi:hypothetical protein